ncbi:hypothetical protein LTR05_007427 [Lithohypha guttulata]|uniref:Meiotically up-regulated gene 154 protein n=1 Tax=Lithohypha guttulata TaxID=1690604 RepID=A0AAN7SV72_9EURO|nr:hypothetical protein LTR05_007427 [Lithohypha guttulata]
MPPFVRKQPLGERIKSALNVYDFLLSVSEGIESYGWDQVEKAWAAPIGVAFNLIFLISRANVGKRSNSYDDVFGESTGSGWAASIAWFFVCLLTMICFLNTFYTFFRKRHYRLFEAPVDVVLSTPSAHRVKLNSSPISSSPLRYLSQLLGSESAESRAHPNAREDVWEISLWDPLPVSLRLFCYFSPGHVILYWMFLPTSPANPRPSTTVATAILLALLLSLQLSFMSSCFSQQGKDSALISKEVMNEYDIKFVRPRTSPLYRDVATQYTEDNSYSQAKEDRYNNVVVFPPAFIINRGFKTNPNPSFVNQADASNGPQQQSTTPDYRSPIPHNNLSSPMRPQTAIKQPVFRPNAGGGSLGVYSHAASPLRKSASTNFSPAKGQYLNDVARNRGSQSPDKRKSTPAGGLVNTNGAQQRWGHLKPDTARRETGNF